MTELVKTETFSVGMIQTNCYLWGERFIIDPGGMNGGLRSRLEDIGSLDAILLTHAHWDHIAGIREVEEIVGECPIYCHSEEREVLSNPELNFSKMQGNPVSIEADDSLENLQLAADGQRLEVIHTPGHTEGSVSLYNEESDTLFSGDLLFQGGIGRTDLPGGDHSTLISSLQNIVEELPDQTRVLPGHGPETTIGREKSSNPYL